MCVHCLWWLFYSDGQQRTANGGKKAEMFNSFIAEKKEILKHETLLWE